MNKYLFQLHNYFSINSETKAKKGVNLIQDIKKTSDLALSHFASEHTLSFCLFIFREFTLDDFQVTFNYEILSGTNKTLRLYKLVPINI